MRAPKIYLETTMFSFYHEERTVPPYPELKAQVCQIFELIKAGEYEPYTSPYATREIDNEPNADKREKMWRLISEYGVKILDSLKKLNVSPICIYRKRRFLRYIGQTPFILQ
jgi:hypothetical protein